MTTTTNIDSRFREAVAAIDAGDVKRLEALLASDPDLAGERLTEPGAWLREKVGGALDGFFKDPFLLWFVTEDPVRNGRLPPNIASVAETIVAAARRISTPTLQEQLDHALRLVSWSWIARQCGVQLALIDVLADAGAALDGNPNNALVNGNVEAARHLVARGAPLSLAAALCLDMWSEAARLAAVANPAQKQFALVLSALNGNAEAVRRVLVAGATANDPSGDLYPHGTPLHHAVCSGSLDTVRALVDAGASITTADAAWHGTPLGWAEHYVGEKKQAEERKRYAAIAGYLRAAAAHGISEKRADEVELRASTDDGRSH